MFDLTILNMYGKCGLSIKISSEEPEILFFLADHSITSTVGKAKLRLPFLNEKRYIHFTVLISYITRDFIVLFIGFLLNFYKYF